MLPLVSTMPTSSLAVSIGAVQCGEKFCSILEYCSDHTSDCEKCSEICEQSHNYDEHLCLMKCRGKFTIFFSTFLPTEIFSLLSSCC